MWTVRRSENNKRFHSFLLSGSFSFFVIAFRIHHGMIDEMSDAIMDKETMRWIAAALHEAAAGTAAVYSQFDK